MGELGGLRVKLPPIKMVKLGMVYCCFTNVIQYILLEFIMENSVEPSSDSMTFSILKTAVDLG